MGTSEDDPARRRREMARNAGIAVSDRMSDLWWTFLIRGVVALLLGLAALIWPTASISLLLRLFGAILVLDAALTLFGVRRRDGQVQDGLPGILSGLIGLVLLVLPASSARLAFVLLGLWALVTGVGYLMTWWRSPAGDPEKETARTVGAMALLGGLVLVLWPATGLVALGWMLAILAFVIAGVMFFLASRFKRLNERFSALRE
mgnify:CR=1 FL=1